MMKKRIYPELVSDCCGNATVRRFKNNETICGACGNGCTVHTKEQYDELVEMDLEREILDNVMDSDLIYERYQ